MSIKLETFIRKPFEVEAVQITEENIYEVAQWCRGEVRIVKDPSGDEKKYIKVQSQHPSAKTKPLAYVKDWISFANRGYKVYTDYAFDMNFNRVSSEASR